MCGVLCVHVCLLYVGVVCLLAVCGCVCNVVGQRRWCLGAGKKKAEGKRDRRLRGFLGSGTRVGWMMGQRAFLGGRERERPETKPRPGARTRARARQSARGAPARPC